MIKEKMLESATFKNIAGVAAGVGVASLLFKIRSPLLLMAFGVGGGVLVDRWDSIKEMNFGSDKKPNSQPIESIDSEEVIQEPVTLVDPKGNTETVIVEDLVEE